MSTLTYQIEQALSVPADHYNADGLAVVLAHGGRYGGAWSIGALGNDQQVIGRIWTEASDDPDLAADTARSWIAEECERAGLKIVRGENLNDQYPADQRPYFTLSRFIIADKNWA